MGANGSASLTLTKGEAPVSGAFSRLNLTFIIVK